MCVPLSACGEKLQEVTGRAALAAPEGLKHLFGLTLGLEQALSLFLSAS